MSTDLQRLQNSLSDEHTALVAEWLVGEGVGSMKEGNSAYANLCFRLAARLAGGRYESDDGLVMEAKGGTVELTRNVN